MSEENTATTVNEPVKADSAAIIGKPGLHPETNEKISSMADAFRNAMKGTEGAPPSKAAEPADAGNRSAEPAANDDISAEDTKSSDSAQAKEKPVSRSAADFKLIKQERDAAKQQVAELLSKLSGYEGLEGVKDDYDKLKSEYDQMSETLTVTNLERHPKFKEQYVKPIEAQIDRAKAYVPSEQRDKIAKILRMPIGDERANALDELTGELPASRQAYLQNIVSRIDEISYERDQSISAARESYEKLQQEENLITEKKTAERNQALEKSFNSMLKQAQDQIGIYQLREGDEEWNTGVRERVNLAKKILMEQNTFEDAATAALWAASGGALVEQNAALVEHNRRLAQELEQLKGAEPSTAGTTGNGASSRSKPGGNSFSDRVMGELRGLGIGAR
jgi:hypothetical protein